LQSLHCCPGKNRAASVIYCSRGTYGDFGEKRFESDLATKGHFAVIFAGARQWAWNLGQTVFSQLIEHLPHNEFQKDKVLTVNNCDLEVWQFQE
jgi:hypothetical protein